MWPLLQGCCSAPNTTSWHRLFSQPVTVGERCFSLCDSFIGVGNGKGPRGLWLCRCPVRCGGVTASVALRRCGGRRRPARGEMDFAAEVMGMLRRDLQPQAEVCREPTGKIIYNLTCLLNNDIILSRNTSSYSKMNALFLTLNLFS